ncbi:phage tail assembly protein, partial [Laribacter hongkongensis]
MNEIVITLKKPIQLNGITVNQLRMREPTLGDQLDVNQLAKSNEEREIMMLSRLCDCAHTDL